MIQGPRFRGISYKVAMGYMSDDKHSRAIKEFMSIPGYELDAQVCELISKCCLKVLDFEGYNKYHDLAIKQYVKEGNLEKSEKLKMEPKK